MAAWLIAVAMPAPTTTYPVTLTTTASRAIGDARIWQKRIKDKDYLWPQYLDENARIATVNNIFSFPHNYLLENGKIIKENLSPEELQEFLQRSFNENH